MKFDTDNKNKNKCVPIFSQKLCGVLLTRGFVLQGLSKNTKLPDKNVFYFAESTSLRDAISDYVSSRG